MAKTIDETSSFTSLLDFAGLLALATALVYATGWIYAYHYFANFQLGILSLDIPAEYYLMYGVIVFRDWWFLALPLLAVAMLMPYLSRQAWWKRYLTNVLSRFNRGIPLFSLLLCLLGLVFVLGESTANRDYQQQRTDDFPNYPRVRVWLKSNDSQDAEYKALSMQLPLGCYRLLLQNADKLYLFLAPAHQPPARLSVVEVALGEVSALRILPQYDSCDE